MIQPLSRHWRSADPGKTSQPMSLDCGSVVARRGMGGPPNFGRHRSQLRHLHRQHPNRCLFAWRLIAPPLLEVTHLEDGRAAPPLPMLGGERRCDRQRRCRGGGRASGSSSLLAAINLDPSPADQRPAAPAAKPPAMMTIEVRAPATPRTATRVKLSRTAYPLRPDATTSAPTNAAIMAMLQTVMVPQQNYQPKRTRWRSCRGERRPPRGGGPTSRPRSKRLPDVRATSCGAREDRRREGFHQQVPPPRESLGRRSSSAAEVRGRSGTPLGLPREGTHTPRQRMRQRQRRLQPAKQRRPRQTQLRHSRPGTVTPARTHASS